MELQRRLGRMLLASHPHDATTVLEGLPLEEASAVLAGVEAATAARVLEWGTPNFSAGVLARLDAATAAPVLALLPPEIGAGLLRRLDEPARVGLLAATSPRARRSLESLLRFPPGTAGALMDPRALGLPGDLTVGEAVRRVHEESQGVLFDLWILDRADVLVGSVNLRGLLAAEPGARLDAIMRSPATGVRAHSDRESVLTHPGWREHHSLPVVDEGGVFLGAIRYSTGRRLETEAGVAGEDPRVRTVRALGDLFSTGMGGVVGAMTSALGPPSPSRRPRENG